MDKEEEEEEVEELKSFFPSKYKYPIELGQSDSF